MGGNNTRPTGNTRAAHLAGIIIAGLALWLAPSSMTTYRAVVVLIGGVWAVGLVSSAIGSILHSIPKFAHKTTRQR